MKTYHIFMVPMSHRGAVTPPEEELTNRINDFVQKGWELDRVIFNSAVSGDEYETTTDVAAFVFMSKSRGE